MNAQVLQIGCSDKLAYRVGHSADTELQTCAVRNFIDDKLRDLLIDFRRFSRRTRDRNRRVVRFDDHVDL